MIAWDERIGIRGSYPEVFGNKAVIKSFVKFTYICAGTFLKKVAGCELFYASPPEYVTEDL